MSTRRLVFVNHTINGCERARDGRLSDAHRTTDGRLEQTIACIISIEKLIYSTHLVEPVPLPLRIRLVSVSRPFRIRPKNSITGITRAKLMQFGHLHLMKRNAHQHYSSLVATTIIFNKISFVCSFYHLHRTVYIAYFYNTCYK